MVTFLLLVFLIVGRKFNFSSKKNEKHTHFLCLRNMIIIMWSDNLSHRAHSVLLSNNNFFQGALRSAAGTY